MDANRSGEIIDKKVGGTAFVGKCAKCGKEVRLLSHKTLILNCEFLKWVFRRKIVVQIVPKILLRIGFIVQRNAKKPIGPYISTFVRSKCCQKLHWFLQQVKHFFNLKWGNFCENYFLPILFMQEMNFELVSKWNMYDKYYRFCLYKSGKLSNPDSPHQARRHSCFIKKFQRRIAKGVKVRV